MLGEGSAGWPNPPLSLRDMLPPQSGGEWTRRSLPGVAPVSWPSWIVTSPLAGTSAICRSCRRSGFICPYSPVDAGGIRISSPWRMRSGSLNLRVVVPQFPRGQAELFGDEFELISRLDDVDDRLRGRCTLSDLRLPSCAPRGCGESRWIAIEHARGGQNDD